MGVKTKSWRFGVNGSIRNFSPTTNTVTPTTQSFTGSTTVTGVSNPRYRQQIAAGENAGTSLTVVAQSLEVLGGGNSATYKTSPTSGYSGDEITNYLGLGPTYPGPSSIPAAQASAVRNLYAKLRQANQQFAGGVFLGELHQTINLMLHPASSLLKFTAQHLARTQHKLIKLKKASASARQLQKAMSDDYLQWTFGVLPLCGDIGDLSKTLQRILNDPPRTRIKAEGEASSGPIITVLGSDELGSLYTRKEQRDCSYTETKYYGMMQEATRDPTVLAQCQRVADLSGFSLRAFVPTVWELIPFSWVADYAVNIQDLLEAATTDTSKVKWLMRTEKSWARREVRYTPDHAQARKNHPTWIYVAQSGSQGGWIATSTNITRSAASVPIMEPRLNFDISPIKHIANLAAVVLSKRGLPI